MPGEMTGLVGRAASLPLARAARGSRRVTARASGSSSGQGGDWKKKVRTYIDDELPKQARKGMKKANLKFEVLADDAKRFYGSIDRKYGISSKARSVAGKVRDNVETVDNKYGVSTKATNVAEELRRNYPEYKRKAVAFSNTPTGKVALYGGFLFLVFSGLYFQLLYFFFMFTLFAPLIQRALGGQEARGGQDPFSNPGFGAFGGAQQQQQQQRRRQSPGSIFDMFSGRGAAASQWEQTGRSGGEARRGEQSGKGSDDIIVDAEWTSLSDDEDSK